MHKMWLNSMLNTAILKISMGQTNTHTHTHTHTQNDYRNPCCACAPRVNEQKVGMLLQKRTDTRGVGISSMRKSIYLLTTTPSSHTHRFHPLPLPTPTSHTHTFHPLSTIVIHTFNLCKVKSMDDNCGEWVECMGVASGCGCKEVYRFPDTTYPYSSCICSFLQQHPYFLFILKMFFVLYELDTLP